MVDVVLQYAWVLYHINKDEGDESLSLLACSFPEIFIRLQNVPSNICYEVAHYQVSSKKPSQCKVWKGNFRCCCVKYKANLHDICFKIFHGYCLVFDFETQDLKMYELVLFNNIFDQVFKRLLGSFFLVFPGRRLSNTFEIQIDLKMKHPWKPLHKHIQNSLKHPRLWFLRK